MYFLADGARPEVEQRRLLETVAASGLPGADAAGYAVSGSWQDALTVLALALPSDRVSIVVLDEVSYLTSDPGFEGALQGVWDTRLATLPVLLILVVRTDPRWNGSSAMVARSTAAVSTRRSSRSLRGTWRP